AEFLRHPFNLKISSRPVANPIPESLQFTGELMVVDVFSEFPRPQQFVILKRLPSVFHCIKRCVEHDAVGVQVRVEGAGGVMREFRGDEIPCKPLASCAPDANTSCRESLEVLQRCLHSPRMGLKNPL